MDILIISLPNAKERRDFQQNQLSKLGLEFEFLDATSIHDLNEAIYKQHYQDWQRPLKTTEVACYYSHRRAWDRVIQSNKPVLILEDDALLSKCIPTLLKDLLSRKDADLINFENRARKKFVSRSGESITCNSKLLRLYQDRTGAAGYILWPSGAKKLIQCEERKGIALADAHITACINLTVYQVEPSPIIQLDHCEYYDIKNPISNNASDSSVSSRNNPKGGVFFWFRRVCSQVKLGIRQLFLVTLSTRRYIKIDKKGFYG